MRIERCAQRRESQDVLAKLDTAEEARLSGALTYTLEESIKRLEAIYQRG